MIRIFIPLAMAIVAFLGPWTAEGLKGSDAAKPTVDCVLDANISFDTACRPAGTLAAELIGYSVVFGAIAAVLSVIGLLPFVGRLTSMTVVAAGMTGLGAAGMAVAAMFGPNGPGLVPELWGVWGTGILGLVAVFNGLGGIRGEGQPDY